MGEAPRARAGTNVVGEAKRPQRVTWPQAGRSGSASSTSNSVLEPGKPKKLHHSNVVLIAEAPTIYIWDRRDVVKNS